MSAITIDYIEESQVEADSLTKLVAIGAVSTVVLSVHVFSMWWMSHTFKRDLLKDVESRNDLFDEEGEIVDRLEAIQQKIKSANHELSRLRISTPLINLNCHMLKKAFNNYSLIITNINEHDADTNIINGNVSTPFNSIEDLINHLDS